MPTYEPTPAHAFTGTGHAGAPGLPEDHVPDPRSRVFVAERPWGQFQQLVHNEQVTVKVITVQPGHRLSLQKHAHRGEMWLVLDHEMHVEIDDREWDAQPGEYVWVPDGATHRLGNRLETPCRILEVAFGHFDEADIERLQDDYSRPPADGPAPIHATATHLD